MSKKLFILNLILIIYSCICFSVDSWFYMSMDLDSFTDYFEDFVLSFLAITVSDFCILVIAIINFFLSYFPQKEIFSAIIFGFASSYISKLVSFAIYFNCTDVHNLFSETYEMYKDSIALIEDYLVGWKFSVVNGFVSIFLYFFIIGGSIFLSIKYNYKKVLNKDESPKKYPAPEFELVDNPI